MSTKADQLHAVPLLALFLPIQVATPLAVLISVVIAAVILIQDWREVHLRSSGWLFVPTLAGIPFGIWMLHSTHPSWVKGVLASVIVLFSGFFLLGKRLPHLEHDSHVWLLGCGFAAGVLGGAYGINGPPLVVYGSMRRWSPQHFRATLQGYFLPASAIGVLGYRVSGLWTAEVTRYFFVAIFAAIPAIFVGRWLNHRLRGDAFLKYVHAGVVAIGIVLLVQALRHR
ncbi:MAG TPA: sulfite exporter TauE/SafE family protein [Polyangiaceae bacterium]|nr:sulfite exporter TauE/SafE family protein [Polyangiaceae bacterium]